MRNKELKIKLQEEISNASLPVRADLSNDLKLFRKLTKEKFYPSWGYFGRNSKNIYNLFKINLSPYETWIISDVPHNIWWNQHNTVYTILVKVDLLHTCGPMICSYFGITFMLFFMKIENAVYKSCQNNTLLFINGLNFGIMNIQNNQSLEFEWKPVLALLRFVIDQRFSCLHNVFLKFFQDWLNSVQ